MSVREQDQAAQRDGGVGGVAGVAGGAEPDRDVVSLTLDPVRVGWVLGGFVLVLMVVHLVTVGFDLPGQRLTDLDHEPSLGTWLSTTMFTVATALCLVLAAPFGRTRRCYAFAGFALVLLAFGVEEVFALHEGVSYDISERISEDPSHAGGTPLLGLAMLPFAAWGIVQVWRSTTARPTSLLVGAGVWYLAAFGLELVEAMNSAGWFDAVMSERTARGLLNGLQEGGEMLGLAVVIMALLVEQGARGRRLSLGAVGPAATT